MLRLDDNADCFSYLANYNNRFHALLRDISTSFNDLFPPNMPSSIFCSSMFKTRRRKLFWTMRVELEFCSSTLERLAFCKLMATTIGIRQVKTLQRPSSRLMILKPLCWTLTS